jgi:adenine-specific DNA-methyltransferase
MDATPLRHGILGEVKEEGLAQYAESLSDQYARNYDANVRKLKGQIFTPKEVSTYMASLFEIHHGKIRLLDPGAGTGILTAAFCERLLQGSRMVELTLDTYEDDRALLPFLVKTLERCKFDLERRGHRVDYNIHKQDFIISNSQHFQKSDLFSTRMRDVVYDFVISNPPYYKLNKSSPQSSAMRELVSGQPNIYALFMALSASMTKPGGEMVFITPRSFCSGLYYKKFREWFLNNVQIRNIHIFESRKEIFDKDEILQENVIIKVEKRKKTCKQNDVIISTSRNKDFDKLLSIAVPQADVVRYQGRETLIRIPTSSRDVDILHIVDRWPATLRDLGLEISTGPVVPFRAEKYLLSDFAESTKSAPLLWMHNMKGMDIVWPVKRNGKASAIRVCDETAPLLLPVRNYVLVKRFSSKEQKRRLHAAVLLESEFLYESVGIENHMNYIYRPKGCLSVYEAFGIAGILNTTIIDNFFRSSNGNTQVNATDIRVLPLPDIEHIERIGKLVYDAQSCRNGFHIEQTVGRILRIKTLA